MKPNSIPRWSIGAVILAVLIACSPQTGPAPQPAAAPGPRAQATSEPLLVEPGYSGIWAFAEDECSDADRTLRLTGKSVSTAPGGKDCAIKSLQDEHPTGRSMIYHIKADCDGGAGVSGDALILSFGASDTVMRMQVNNRAPVRLVRCPTPQTP